MSEPYPRWTFFPRSALPPPWVEGIVSVLEANRQTEIDAIYTNGRLGLPFEGVLLFGYYVGRMGLQNLLVGADIRAIRAATAEPLG